MNFDGSGSVETDKVLLEHDLLLSRSKHCEAKVLLQDALIAAYEDNPMSMDVTRILDALALGCKEKEQFQEASVYLAQSLAIKKHILGPKHPDIVIAMRRLGFCLDPDRARVMRVATKRLAKELGLQDQIVIEPFLLTGEDMVSEEHLLTAEQLAKLERLLNNSES